MNRDHETQAARQGAQAAHPDVRLSPRTQQYPATAPKSKPLTQTPASRYHTFGVF
jgi:hypothetical protein